MNDVVEAIDVNALEFKAVEELRLPLVNRFYSSCNYRVKCGRFEKTYTLSLQGSIVAATRLIPQRSGHFLLRNLCVLPALRHQGVASHLIRVLMPVLAPANCYCYALPHLQQFYLSLDFTHLQPDQTPVDIREMYIRHCERKRGWILMGFVNQALPSEA